MPFDVNNTESLVRMLQSQSQANSAASMQAAERQMAFQTAQNAKAMEFSAHQAELQRAWSERLANTAHQREMKDLIAAGLNPVLTATGGAGAATPSGSTASGITSAGALAQVDTSANQAVSSIIGSVLNSAASMHNAETSAKAVVEAAGIAAAANKYIAENFPQTSAGLLREVITGVTGGGISSTAERVSSTVESVMDAVSDSWSNNKTYYDDNGEEKTGLSKLWSTITDLDNWGALGAKIKEIREKKASSSSGRGR